MKISSCSWYCAMAVFLIAISARAEDAPKQDLMGDLFGAIKEQVGTTIEKNKAEEAEKRRVDAEQEALRAERQRAAEAKAKFDAEVKKAEAQVQPGPEANAKPPVVSQAVNAKGKPVLDANGKPVFVDSQGQPVQVDDQGKPVLDARGKLIPVDVPQKQVSEADKKFRFETENNKTRDDAVSRNLSEQLQYKEQLARDKVQSEKKN